MNWPSGQLSIQSPGSNVCCHRTNELLHYFWYFCTFDCLIQFFSQDLGSSCALVAQINECSDFRKIRLLWKAKIA